MRQMNGTSPLLARAKVLQCSKGEGLFFCHRGSLTQTNYADRAIMALPRWQKSGGRDFVFYHSHSGFEWDDLETTNKYQEMLCHDFQVRLPHTLI